MSIPKKGLVIKGTSDVSVPSVNSLKGFVAKGTNGVSVSEILSFKKASFARELELVVCPNFQK